MDIKLFNTLTRQAERFTSLRSGKVSMYSCGPTVYGYAHIGNLRTYVFVDLLKRMLVYNGYKVKHVMNVTDVGHLTSDADAGEDKIQAAAKREHKTAWDISRFYEGVFKEKLQALHIEPPTIWCRATEFIEQQVGLIQKLEEKNFTYRTADGVYFDTSKFESYGYLARLDQARLKPGARVEVGDKRNPADFALWKFSPPDKKRDMEWNSPWGTGFPGWHIECSAMAMHFLGETIDIHTGGIDHIPVHHTNEIAQSEAVTGRPFVRFWLHSNFLLMKNEKMAKSAGAFLTLQDIQDRGIDPLAYRYLCLTAHYRSELQFSWETLESAVSAFNNVRARVMELQNGLEQSPVDPDKVAPIRERFINAINNDLDLPGAIAVLWAVLKEPLLSNSEKYSLVSDFDKVLGLDFGRLAQSQADLPDIIRKLIQEREKARSNKDWKKADMLRDEIQRQGYSIRDTPQGIKWSKEAPTVR